MTNFGSKHHCNLISRIIMEMILFLMKRLPPASTLLPYTTLFRSGRRARASVQRRRRRERRARGCGAAGRTPRERGRRDRKSTRLNSSHVRISYAVFCLKKKTKTTHNMKEATRRTMVAKDAAKGGI